MTNKQFLKELAKNSGMTVPEVTDLMSKFSELIAEGIAKDETLALQGFGNFEVKTKAEKKMYNPTTKSFRIIPASKSLAFRPSSLLKDKMNPANNQE